LLLFIDISVEEMLDAGVVEQVVSIVYDIKIVTCITADASDAAQPF
jgi:hypothetical protein